MARYEKGRWSPSVKEADGVQHAGKRYPTWNPVLFQPSKGPLLLFYKVGPSPQEWWGMLMTSTDDGRTWSEPRRLPEDILGPIKNKPIQLADGTIVAGSSTEAVGTDEWRVHVEITRDLGRTWELVGPLGSGGFNAIQPGILQHADGRLQMLCRSKEMSVPTSWSSDGGRTWTPLAESGLYAVNSGSDAVTLKDGRHLLVYNYRDKKDGVPDNYKPDALVGIANAPSGLRARWPLVVSVSRDGVAWKQAVTLENTPNRHGYAYPAMIQTRDGKVHIAYTFNRERSSTWCSIRRSSELIASLAGAGELPLSQEAPLGRVASQLQRVAKVSPGWRRSSGAKLQLAERRRIERISREPVAVLDRFDRFEPRFGSFQLRDGDGAVQRDDR